MLLIRIIEEIEHDVLITEISFRRLLLGDVAYDVII